MRNAAERSGPPWTPKSVAVAAFFLLFLLIQTVVPLVRLKAPRPARFGWQMFSAIQPRSRFTLVMRDGTSRRPDLTRYVALSRGEVELEKALPGHLCRVVPELAAVRVVTEGVKQARVYPCR